MSDFIQNLEIKNYKSIKSLGLECKRINIFIGDPNVGKSNIIEAISLLCAPHSNSVSLLSDFIRYTDFSELFYDKDIRNDISVTTLNELNTKNILTLRRRSNWNDYELFSIPYDRSNEFLKNNSSQDNQILTSTIIGALAQDQNITFAPFYFAVNPNGTLIVNASDFKRPKYLVKKYEYPNDGKISYNFDSYLTVPFGTNLGTIIQLNKEFRQEIGEYFKKYGLEFVIDYSANSLQIQKKIEDIVYTYPYTSVADTLRRIVFYIAAIISNKGSILLFEEPEAHVSPKFIFDFVDRIRNDHENQYFISTHSPYILDRIIENQDRSQFNIIKTYYENYQTKCKIYTDSDIDRLLNGGADILYKYFEFE